LKAPVGLVKRPVFGLRKEQRVRGRVWAKGLRLYKHRGGGKEEVRGGG
jgi:hypothetical protein